MPEHVVTLPTLYPAQVDAFNLLRRTRRLAVRCGRRWGKTDFAKTLAGDAMVKGRSVGVFTPDYKIQAEAFNELVTMIEPIKASSSKVEGVIRTITGGRTDFWTLENERAGRSRKYHLAIIDEAAFGKDNVIDIFEKSIAPTLLDYQGKCVALSNANGISPNNFFYKICTEEKYGFTEYHGPTSQNPFIPMRLPGEAESDWRARREAEFEKIKASNHPLVYQQEYLAEFVDWSGVAFFARDSLLVDGQPVNTPTFCDAVYAVIDTGVKTGKENDGTAVGFFSTSKHVGHPITVLDWDYVQIEGSLLEAWLPTVFRRLEELARQTKAQIGSVGVFIEDQNAGTILIQQGRRRGWNTHAIDSRLCAMGKDERAISVSGYVYRGEVKMTRDAYEKVTVFKGTSRNHMMQQIVGYRVGVKDGGLPHDDLLDVFCYGVAIGLGDWQGF